MGKANVTTVAATRVKRTEGDKHFCQTCTAYVGNMAGSHECLGDPVLHVAAKDRYKLLNHDHLDS